VIERESFSIAADDNGQNVSNNSLGSSDLKKINTTFLSAWIIIEEKGEICCAHCNCMAGLGETSSMWPLYSST